jgi:hypothetical protein
MALLYMQGFDWLDSTAVGQPVQDLIRQQTRTPSDMTTGTDSDVLEGRNGTGKSLQFNFVNQHLRTPLIHDSTGADVLFIGFAAKTNSVWQNNKDWLRIYTGETVHINFRYVTSTNVITMSRGISVVATSPANLLLPDVWQYIEFEINIDNTAGYVNMWVDGVQVWTSATNIDTMQTTGLTFDNVRFHMAGLTLPCILDDVYVCDNTGTVNNTQLGDSTVELLLPTGDGSLSGWTPSSGTDHYAMVDDAPLAVEHTEATYLTSTTDGVELFEYSSLPATLPKTSVVHGLQVNSYLRRTDGISRFQAVAKVDASETSVIAYGGGLGDDNLRENIDIFNYPAIFETSPASSDAWSHQDINNAEFGIKHIS